MGTKIPTRVYYMSVHSPTLLLAMYEGMVDEVRTQRKIGPTKYVLYFGLGAILGFLYVWSMS